MIEGSSFLTDEQLSLILSANAVQCHRRGKDCGNCAGCDVLTWLGDLFSDLMLDYAHSPEDVLARLDRADLI